MSNQMSKEQRDHIKLLEQAILRSHATTAWWENRLAKARKRYEGSK